MTSRTPSLALKNLVVRAPSGRVLVSVPELSVAPGETMVIRGPSGAGKSTLLYALAGLIDVADGLVCWGRTEISALPDRARSEFRRSSIGFVFQDHHLFEELSALGNAGLAAAYAPRIDRAAIRAGAQDGLARLGLAEAGHRRIASFSGGERQRVAVARALAGNPAIVLADEPTASLDRDNADALIDDLMSVAGFGDRTLIVVSHDEAFHTRADRVVTLRDGEVVHA